MATQKISEMTETIVLQDEDYVPIVQSGLNRKIKIEYLRDYNKLHNKPTLNGVTIENNKKLSDYNVVKANQGIKVNSNTNQTLELEVPTNQELEQRSDVNKAITIATADKMAKETAHQTMSKEYQPNSQDNLTEGENQPVSYKAVKDYVDVLENKVDENERDIEDKVQKLDEKTAAKDSELENLISTNEEDIESKVQELDNKKLNKEETPKTLPNPNKLIFTGAVSDEYDGSIEKTISIPEGGSDYTLPQATEELLGGIKAKAKTDETVEVAIGDDGKLYVSTYPAGGTIGQVLTKSSDNDGDANWQIGATNEKNFSASVKELIKVGTNSYLSDYRSIMFMPSVTGVLKVGTDNLIGQPYSGKANEMLEPTIVYTEIKDGYSLDWNEDYTGTKIWQNTRFGFSVNLESGKTYTLSLKTNKNSTVYLFGVEHDNKAEVGSLIATISNVNGTGETTFTVSSDYNRLRFAPSDVPIELTEITLTEGETALIYGGGAKEYNVTENIPLYIDDVYGLNCVGSGVFYASPFAITSLNGIYTNGKAKTYATDKYFVNMGDSIWTFGSNTGGIGNISDYMVKKCGGTWINIATGGTTMANRPGDKAGPYDALDFHALADCIYSGDFSTAKNSGLTTNLDANVDSIVWDDVDYITVAYGTNDLAFGATLDSESNLYDKNTLCGALRYGIERINSKYPNIKFIVCGILYRHADGVSVSNIVEWNEGLRKACISVGAEYIEMSCGINEGNYNTYLYDGTHPNEQGKIAISNCVAKNIINIEGGD